MADGYCILPWTEVDDLAVIGRLPKALDTDPIRRLGSNHRDVNDQL